MAAAHRDAVVREVLTEARAGLDGERQKLLETGEYAAVSIVQDHQAPRTRRALLEGDVHPVATLPVARDRVPQHDGVAVRLEIVRRTHVQHTSVEDATIRVGTEETVLMGKIADGSFSIGNLRNGRIQVFELPQRERVRIRVIADPVPLSDSALGMRA